MLIGTWATPTNDKGLDAANGEALPTLGAGGSVPDGLGLIAEGVVRLGAGEAHAFDRQWTIGNIGDDYGYDESSAIGDLVPNEWFDDIDTVETMLVDQSATAAVFTSATMSQWNGLNSVTLDVEGFGQIVLTWNGAAYVNVGDAAFEAYIVGQLGNTIGVDILPRP
jgi:hypothetical protein